MISLSENISLETYICSIKEISSLNS